MPLHLFIVVETEIWSTKKKWIMQINVFYSAARSLRMPLERAEVEDSSDVDSARPKRIVAERRALVRSASGV